MPETENQTAAASAEEKKPVRAKMPEQNGIRQPAPGTVVGAVWDAASKISEEKGRPATRAEVRDYLGERVNPATIATQYARWVRFYGVSDRLKAMRGEVMAAKSAEKEKAAEARKADSTAKQAEKHAAREQRRVEREAKKAEREADRKAKAAQKEADKKAAADAKAAEAAKAAQAAAAAAPPGA